MRLSTKLREINLMRYISKKVSTPTEDAKRRCKRATPIGDAN
jgi:hypothetical protein